MKLIWRKILWKWRSNNKLDSPTDSDMYKSLKIVLEIDKGQKIPSVINMNFQTFSDVHLPQIERFRIVYNLDFSWEE